MKKIFIILLLLIIIFGSFGFIFLKIESFGSDANFFNRNLRYKFARYQPLRRALGLHNYGDARADYLGPGYKNIKIEIYAMTGLAVGPEVLTDLKKDLEGLTSKTVTSEIIDSLLPYSRSVSQSEIDGLIAKRANKISRDNSVKLFLFFFSQKDAEPKLLGSTYNENGIIIFNDALANFASQTPKIFNSYELSTILHEVGHQLGLQHNILPGCLMNEKAEINDNAKSNLNEVITNFCPYEINQIKTMLY